MVEGRCPDRHVVELEGVPGPEVRELELSPHRVQGHREHRLHHLPLEHAPDAALLGQVPGPDHQVVPGAKRGEEERKAVDVVPVRVGQEQVGLLEALLEDVA